MSNDEPYFIQAVFRVFKAPLEVGGPCAWKMAVYIRETNLTKQLEIPHIRCFSPVACKKLQPCGLAHGASKSGFILPVYYNKESYSSFRSIERPRKHDCSKIAPYLITLSMLTLLNNLSSNEDSKGRGTNNPAGRPGNERDIPAVMFYFGGPGSRHNHE